jgi:hypothetical protein
VTTSQSTGLSCRFEHETDLVGQADDADMSPVKVELHLPGFVIGTDDIRTVFRRKSKASGPCLIINRACGLAIDTAFGVDLGVSAHMWPPHGLRHQLWELRPSGTAGEVVIVSVANGLALDATTPTTGDIKPVMWEVHREPWQRWRLEDSPDGIGYLIQSVHNRRYLTVNEDGQAGWEPWFEERHARLPQQWLLALPHGRGNSG